MEGFKVSEKSHGPGLGDATFLSIADKEYLLTVGSKGDVFVRFVDSSAPILLFPARFLFKSPF